MSYIDDEELKIGVKSDDNLDDEEGVDGEILDDGLIDDDLDLEDDDPLIEGFAGLDGSEY